MDEMLIARDKKRLRNHFNIDKKRRTEQHRQVAPHFHDYYEMYYMWEGECRFFLHDTIYNLEKGDILLIAPGDYHSSTYDHKGYHDRCAIYFDTMKIDRRVLAYLPFPPQEAGRSRQFRIVPSAMDTLHGYLNRMLSYYGEGDDYGDLVLDHMFQEFLLFLAVNCEFDMKRKQVNETDLALERAARYIASNYGSEISLNDAARVAGLTPTYFSKKFKELTEVGYRDYLMHIRLKQAALMLRTTRDTVQEISQKCGFTSGNYFGDVFRTAYGMSPREYRKSEIV